MGVSGGPNMIDDGLVLALDASSTYLPVNKNLLTYTDDLTNAAWSKVRSQITASAAIAPDGTNTAFAMTITDATALVRISQNVISTSVVGGPYTLSVYVKQNNISASLFDTGIYNLSTTSGSEPSYDILNNFVATGGNGVWVSNRTVTWVGNGWYRVATTATIPNNSSWYLFFDIEAGTGTKVNGQNLYLWGPQFEYGTTATEYQPVNIIARIWPNQANTSMNGSLINNPAFDSANGGSIVFDGVDDYANAIPSSYSLTTGSITMFISHSLQNYYLSYYDRPNNRGSAYTGIIPTGIVQVGVTYNGTNHFFHINGNTYQADIFGVYAYDSVTPQSAGLFGRARSDSGTSDNVYTYNFSMVPTSSGYSGTPNANTFFENFTTSSAGFFSYTQCIIGKLPAVTRPRNFTGKIYNLNVYSKPLTDQEILQNYNALKSRFNL